jgi:hypothetical protein
VVQHYAAADLESLFNIRGAKVIGFAKSGLAQSIYSEMKDYRINRPPCQTEGFRVNSPVRGIENLWQVQ